MALNGHSAAVERLDALTSGYPLIGVEVQSDVPVISRRVVWRVGAHGKRVVVGRSGGVDAHHAAWSTNAAAASCSPMVAW